MLEGIKKIIVDLDGGPDDAHALFILLHAETQEKVKILAIVCSSGNAKVDYVCRTVLRLLKLCNRTDIPVYKGSQNFIIPPKLPVPDLFGKDGFGDLSYEEEPDMAIIKTESAAIAFRQLTINYPKEISLICLAPLTNVALAIQLFDDFTEYLKDIHILGGNYTAMGFGKYTAEFNMYCDPEAMHIILENVKCPVKILPLETCMAFQPTLEWRFNNLGKLSNPHLILLNDVEKKIQNNLKEDYWLPCDAYLASAFLYPDKLIAEEVKHKVAIELNGKYTRGQLILNDFADGDPNISIIKKINGGNFYGIITDVYDISSTTL